MRQTPRTSLVLVLALAVLPAMSGTEEETTPPIDCPLRNQGVDTHNLKPFEEVEEYIAFLERADRAAWQRPDAIVDALGLSGTEIIADVGAGSGYFTFRFAEALSEGRVRAIDIEPEMLRHIHHKSTSTGVSNIEVVVAAPDDPHVAGDEDLVFICDVLHHVEDREAWLARLFSETKTGARLAVVEFKEGDLPQGPPEAMKIPKASMIELVSDAGFVLADDRSELLPYQSFLVFSKP
jgi:2-polyprenyl-3-methyl-5-hydroxy-6-metoxy-1,4-benzoquinol methylase